MYFQKIFLALVFLTLILNAQSSPYVGVTYESSYDWLKQDKTGEGSERINPLSYGLKLDLGIDNGEDLRTNMFFAANYFDTDPYLYEAKNGIDKGSSHQIVYGLGFDIIKTYSDKGSSVLPYLKGGMAYEFIPLQGYAQGWANNVAFTFGMGSFLRSSDMLEWQLGVYYKYRMWGNYNLDTEYTSNLALSHHAVIIELGLNFHY